MHVYKLSIKYNWSSITEKHEMFCCINGTHKTTGLFQKQIVCLYITFDDWSLCVDVFCLFLKYDSKTLYLDKYESGTYS